MSKPPTAAEIWKAHPDFDGQYLVSTHGRVKTLARTVIKRTRSGGFASQKYRERLMSVTLYKGYGTVRMGGRAGKPRSIHRLVLETFVGPCPEGMEGCHNDGDSTNNWLSNLRWDTHFNNNQDRVKHGTYATGERHPMAKLQPDAVRSIKVSSLSDKALAAAFGIGKSQVRRIKTGESWGHL